MRDTITDLIMRVDDPELRDSLRREWERRARVEVERPQRPEELILSVTRSTGPLLGGIPVAPPGERHYAYRMRAVSVTTDGRMISTVTASSIPSLYLDSEDFERLEQLTIEQLTRETIRNLRESAWCEIDGEGQRHTLQWQRRNNEG